MRIAPLLLAVALPVTAAADEVLPSKLADDAAAYGMFLPFSTTPANPASAVRTYGLYSGARDRTALVVDGRALVSSRLLLQAGASFEGNSLYSRAGLAVGILRDDRQGLDLQLGGGWTEAGANTLPAVYASLDVGHDLGGTYLLGGARYDFATDLKERGLVLTAGSVRPIGLTLYAGLNTELRLDLEGGEAEPMGESDWSLMTGPVVTYVASHFAITASGGIAFDKPVREARETGGFGLVGLGAGF